MYVYFQLVEAYLDTDEFNIGIDLCYISIGDSDGSLLKIDYDCFEGWSFDFFYLAKTRFAKWIKGE